METGSRELGLVVVVILVLIGVISIWNILGPQMKDWVNNSFNDLTHESTRVQGWTGQNPTP